MSWQNTWNGCCPEPVLSPKSQPVSTRGRMVGVIASAQDLELGLRMRQPPDLFELRLDLLRDLDLARLPRVPRPVIITARHPAEGGAGNLSAASRRNLLFGLIPRARWIDLEMRALSELADVWRKARGRKRICSVHYLRETPPRRRLQRDVRRAHCSGADMIKLVARAETHRDWLALLETLLWAKSFTAITVMATGKFGVLSRQIFPVCGSAMVYAALSRPLYPGQPTLTALRRSLAPSRLKPNLAPAATRIG